jgi:6-phosphogluconolactonase (cycloisomerase 2 family)
MRFVTRLAGAFAGTAAALTLTASLAAAAPSQPDTNRGPRPSADHAVFVQTENPAGNAVVAFKRGSDGKLVKAGTYPTGGKGGALGEAKVDFLATQGGLTYDADNHLLYAVNAGSNSVTVFGVDGTRLVKKQTVPSGGDFPASIAVHDGLVYVLNARSGGSIQGFREVAGHLLKVPGWNRPLGLDPNPPEEFTHTPGQVLFTPDGSKVLVTTKANTSSVEVFSISGLGRPSSQPVTTELPGKVPFAGEFDGAGHLLLTEAGPNALATFSIDSKGALHEIATVATGQEATCWVIWVGGKAYVSNAASASVSSFGIGASGSLTALGNTATHKGTVDAAQAEGRFLYVQTGAEGIVDEFKIGPGGSLTPLGSVTVPDSVGGQGIVTT